MKRVIATLATAALFSGIAAQKPAVVASDKPGWHKIGETTVDFTREEDQVAVLAADRFAYLKFKVVSAPIEIIDIDVFFEEGDKQNIRIGAAIKAEGSESGPIDLEGAAERSIKRIVFRYRTVEKGKNKKARVEIWGKKTNTPKDAGKNNKGKVKKSDRDPKG